MREPVFLIALAMLGTAVVLVARTIAGAITGRGGSRSELAQLKEQVQDAQNTLANQSNQIAELQERVDFAERMLAQARARSPLGPGDQAR